MLPSRGDKRAAYEFVVGGRECTTLCPPTGSGVVGVLGSLPGVQEAGQGRLRGWTARLGIDSKWFGYKVVGYCHYDVQPLRQ